MVSDSADVTSAGRSFQICGPTTGKATIIAIMVATVKTMQMSCWTNKHKQTRLKHDQGVSVCLSGLYIAEILNCTVICVVYCFSVCIGYVETQRITQELIVMTE